MEFRLLGPLEVLSEGQPVPIGGARQRGVLALLLLAPNEVVSTDRLIDEVWGHRPPKSVEASLQNCISNLRAVIGRELIETRAPGYVLKVDAGSVDVLRFEQALEASRELDPPERSAALREALALWRGPPLADLELEGAARATVSRLDELRLAALEERIDAELALGHHDTILGEIEALATRHPAREHLRYLQMLALYRAGRQRDALRVYQEVRLELVEEFGLEPSESLHTLERMIIAHDPSLRLSPAAPDLSAREPLRRNVVVAIMELVDLEGATAAARRAAAAALAEIAMVIERHGGSVRQLLAEELVAVFGVPAAHDDDTSRALRAVIEARAAVPPRFVAVTAVERLSGEADISTELDAVRRLLAQAAPGDLLLGPEALRLVPSAVDVVPHESGTGYRVLRFDPNAEPFARHPEAPIVGRRRELAALDAAFEEVAASGSPRRVVLVGEAGIGKTRLARAFLDQVGPRAQVLSGRCPAYGDGAALRPLVQILEQVGPVESLLAREPDAERIAARLREWSFSEPSESFWALRRLLEAIAAERPVVLAFEDVHWAGSTFLDLVEYLVGWSAAPLLVLCVAWPDLLEARPAWREDAIALEPLSPAESQQLVSALPESGALHEAEAAAAVEAAEGNPLFLEQLVSFAAEEEPGSLPPTLEVLIASRVDRLPEQERAILERASVAGRHFWRSTVEATSPADERAAVGLSLMALVRRRLILPERASVLGEDGFCFQHVLIRDAVYAGVSEASRAELHESVARSLDGHGPELDEAIGYHLERAVLLRAARGAPDATLTQEAGRRLGAAGMRALKRVDGRAAQDLLGRAVALLADGDESKLELEWALGVAAKFAGDPARAQELLDDVVAKSAAARNARIEHLARIEQVWPRLARGELSTAEALEVAERGKAIFERAGDDFGLGRAWHCTATVRAVYELRYGDISAAAVHIRRHYERAGFALGSVTFLLAGAAYRGPTPVGEAIERCRSLLVEAGTPVWQSFILPMLAALEAMEGQFELARAHLDEARIARREFSDTGTIVTSWAALAAEVELLAGEPGRAEEILVTSCDELRAVGETEWLATNSALLAEALYRQERYAEALSASASALAIAPPGHLTSRVVAQRVQAKALARAGRLAEAQALAAETIELLAATDVLYEQGEAFVASAEVRTLAGAAAEAEQDREKAVEVFERKGNAVSAARAREGR
jgi:DNA-binding SARP family transcriptional activator/tetratricopeptide (TPR) repeat protein